MSMSYAAPGSNIPLWIKNNAEWWANDKISDEDYLSGIQYLVTNGIITIPVREVLATHSTISDSERAHGFVVHMKFPAGEKTFYSFTRIIEFPAGQTINKLSPRLQLESIPSTDKAEFYKLVDLAIAGQQQQKIDISLDIITPDGKVIETIKYTTCEITAHWVYVNDNKDEYRFTKNDGPEVREVTDFMCAGYRILTP